MNALLAASRRLAGILWENRWTIGVPVATLLLPATIYAVRLPEVYKASAIVLIKNVGAGQTGGPLPVARELGTEHTLSTARDRLLSNANAAAVVPILFPGASPADRKWINGVQARVEYDQVGEAAFRVGIEDTSPQRSADAVNRLLDAFLENERNVLLEDAEQRAAFHERELAEARSRFNALQAEVEAFRTAHQGTMPDQKESVSSELRSIEAETRDREAQAASARRLSQEYEKLLKQAPQEIRGAQRSQSAEEEQLGLQLKGAQQSLDTATKELAEAQQRYTAKHPTVVQLQRVADDLRAKVDRTSAELDGARKRADSDASLRRRADQQSFLDAMERLRASVTEDEARATKAADELRQRGARLQAQLSAMPATETAFVPLKHGIEQSSKTLEALIKVAGSARQVAGAFRGDVRDLTDFQIQERAVPPVSPWGPKRWKYLLTAVGMGLLISYGLVLLRSRYEEGTVASPDDLAALLPGALVVSVPLLGEGRRRWRLHLGQFALGAWVLFCVGTSAYALAARKGLVTPPGFLRSLLGGGA